MSAKKKLYVDLDNVLVDFKSAFEHLPSETIKKYKDKMDEVPGIFSLMSPMLDAIESYNLLASHFDTYILSTAPWENDTAWSDKLKWVKKYLGQVAHKRLILSHHKNLCEGDFLIDDRINNGAIDFKGQLILFGSEHFPDWKSVIKYLIVK